MQAKNEMDLTVYVPCYNEEKLVARTLDTIREALAGFALRYEVLVYNDASTDRTGAVVAEYIAAHGLEGPFTLVNRERNTGIGINYFDAAARGVGEYFIVVFGDNAGPVEALRRVFNLIGKADVIIPYFDTRLFDLRFNGDHRGFARRAISIVFAWLVRVISGHNIKYFNGFVIHRRANVLRHRTETYGLGYQAELLCAVLSEPGTSFLEVKVFNYDRVEGMPTAFKFKNVRSVLGSLWRILKNRRFGRPEKPRRHGLAD
ncbi:MAG: glycosyltransferase family 2 protein [Candidatus Marinimicrobia bacterium]|nr:glycosyltransferase family 2 protein [Candidatus Neomarinimicrobiota bacterium]